MFKRLPWHQLMIIHIIESQCCAIMKLENGINAFVEHGLIGKMNALSLFIDNIFINRFDDNVAEWLYKHNIEYNDARIYDCGGCSRSLRPFYFSGHHKKNPFYSYSVGLSLAPDMCLLVLWSFVFRYKIIQKKKKQANI